MFNQLTPAEFAKVRMEAGNTPEPITIFSNIEVSIGCEPRRAYSLLCAALAGIEKQECAEFVTDTFAVNGGIDRDTSELWDDDEDDQPAPQNRQEAYDKITRIAYYLSTTRSATRTMETITLLDQAQQIIRIESKMAGNEVQ